MRSHRMIGMLSPVTLGLTAAYADCDIDIETEEDRMKQNTCNLSEEELAEQNRHISRQERRQRERLAAKGR